MAVLHHIDETYHHSAGSGTGFLVGIILLGIFVFLLLYYGIPMLRSNIPQAPQVNIPGKIDVKINK